MTQNFTLKKCISLLILPHIRLFYIRIPLYLLTNENWCFLENNDILLIIFQPLMNFSGPRPPGQTGRGGALLRLRQDVQDRPRRRRQRRVQRPRQMPLHVVNIKLPY